MRDVSIHTSDRILFKRCRRKWGWASRLRRNLVPKSARPNENLWFGSGWHFAMEDFHGYHLFPEMFDAFNAYVKAHPESLRPYNWDDYVKLAKGMADYYTRYWLPRHNDFHTLWLREGETIPRKPGDGIPQLEIDFELPIPGRDDVPFGGTFDGIMIDDHGRWWIKEIKTAKKIDYAKLDTDPQISAYCMAAENHYQHEFEGVVYLQFVKDVPKVPTLLKAGKDFSQDLAKLKTTYDVYLASVRQHFGEVPERYQDTLDTLLDRETFEGNGFIRIDRVTRNEHQIRSEGWKLQGETEDMMNPNLILYPNATYNCSRDCEFKAACLAADDGSDPEDILEEEFEPRRDSLYWRDRLEVPSPPRSSAA